MNYPGINTVLSPRLRKMLTASGVSRRDIFEEPHMVSRFQAVMLEISLAPGSISLGLCRTRWRPGVRAVSGTDRSRREKMCLVV